MTRSPKKSTALQAAIAAGLFVAIIVLLVVVGLDSKRVASEVIKTRTGINTRTKQAQNVAQLKEEAVKAGEKQEILEGILPKKDQLFYFSDEIAAIGAQNTVEASFSFGSESGNQIEYNLTGVGDFGNIIDFVKVLEDDVSFINISTFNLGFKDGKHSISLNGNVFFNGEE